MAEYLYVTFVQPHPSSPVPVMAIWCWNHDGVKYFGHCQATIREFQALKSTCGNRQLVGWRLKESMVALRDYFGWPNEWFSNRVIDLHDEPAQFVGGAVDFNALVTATCEISPFYPHACLTTLYTIGHMDACIAVAMEICQRLLYLHECGRMTHQVLLATATGNTIEIPVSW